MKNETEESSKPEGQGEQMTGVENHFFDTNLKLLRKQKGLNQADIADTCGINRSSIAHYEKGTSMPRVDHLISIGGLLDEGIDKLLFHDFRTGPPPEKTPGAFEALKAENAKLTAKLAGVYEEYIALMKKYEELKASKS